MSRIMGIFQGDYFEAYVWPGLLDSFREDENFEDIVDKAILALRQIAFLSIKVSIHTAMVTTLSILLVEFYEWSSWIFLVIPLVAASRLILKRHSWLEVALGVALPFVFYFSL